MITTVVTGINEYDALYPTRAMAEAGMHRLSGPSRAAAAAWSEVLAWLRANGRDGMTTYALNSKHDMAYDVAHRLADAMKRASGIPSVAPGDPERNLAADPTPSLGCLTVSAPSARAALIPSHAAVALRPRRQFDIATTASTTRALFGAFASSLYTASAVRMAVPLERGRVPPKVAAFRYDVTIVEREYVAYGAYVNKFVDVAGTTGFRSTAFAIASDPTIDGEGLSALFQLANETRIPVHAACFVDGVAGVLTLFHLDEAHVGDDTRVVEPQAKRHAAALRPTVPQLVALLRVPCWPTDAKHGASEWAKFARSWRRQVLAVAGCSEALGVRVVLQRVTADGPCLWPQRAEAMLAILADAVYVRKSGAVDVVWLAMRGDRTVFAEEARDFASTAMEPKPVQSTGRVYVITPAPLPVENWTQGIPGYTTGHKLKEYDEAAEAFNDWLRGLDGCVAWNVLATKASAKTTSPPWNDNLPAPMKYSSIAKEVDRNFPSKTADVAKWREVVARATGDVEREIAKEISEALADPDDDPNDDEDPMPSLDIESSESEVSEAEEAEEAEEETSAQTARAGNPTAAEEARREMELVQVRVSDVTGAESRQVGVFARKSIPRGTRICRYNGKRLAAPDAAVKWSDARTVYTITLREASLVVRQPVVLDGHDVPGYAKLINHVSDPTQKPNIVYDDRSCADALRRNPKLQRVWVDIVASRAIAEGEELLGVYSEKNVGQSDLADTLAEIRKEIAVMPRAPAMAGAPTTPQIGARSPMDVVRNSVDIEQDEKEFLLKTYGPETLGVMSVFALPHIKHYPVCVVPIGSNTTRVAHVQARAVGIFEKRGLTCFRADRMLATPGIAAATKVVLVCAPMDAGEGDVAESKDLPALRQDEVTSEVHVFAVVIDGQPPKSVSWNQKLGDILYTTKYIQYFPVTIPDEEGADAVAAKVAGVYKNFRDAEEEAAAKGTSLSKSKGK